MSSKRIVRRQERVAQHRFAAELRANQYPVPLLIVCPLTMFRRVFLVFHDGTDNYLAVSCLREGLEYRGSHC